MGESPQPSFESRLREMAVDRLSEAVQFARSREDDTIECGSTTALLLSMAETLRACMRDWPNMEDNADASVERLESIAGLKKALKEARRLVRSSAVDSLAFVCSDALFLMAEQWPIMRKAAEKARVETFPVKRHSGGGAVEPAIKRQRFPLPKGAQFFAPPYGEDIEGTSPSVSVGLDSLQSLINQNLNGFIKEEMGKESSSSIVETEQADVDLWNPLAAFAAVTSSTQPSHSREGAEPTRSRVLRYYCAECGVGCVAKSQLDSHMNVHSGNRPFGCEHCDKTYKRKDHLSDHIKKNHPREYAETKRLKEEAKELAMRPVTGVIPLLKGLGQ